MDDVAFELFYVITIPIYLLKAHLFLVLPELSFHLIEVFDLAIIEFERAEFANSNQQFTIIVLLDFARAIQTAGSRAVVTVMPFLKELLELIVTQLAVFLILLFNCMLFDPPDG